MRGQVSELKFLLSSTCPPPSPLFTNLTFADPMTSHPVPSFQSIALAVQFPSKSKTLFIFYFMIFFRLLVAQFASLP